MQAADGYAYELAVLRFNRGYSEQVNALVSTGAQGDWWDSDGGGTVTHAAIACFLGDVVETMVAFAHSQPPEIAPIAMVDFNNDSVRDSLAVLHAYFPRLVWLVRQALNREWENWDLPLAWRARAADYCRAVRIVASGGFTPEKINWFEDLGVPVDAYGVGSSLMSNEGALGTNTDCTTDVVWVRTNEKWVDLAKVRLAPCDNLNLEPVDLQGL